nr:OmpA family protein [Atopomonas sediminilitoris]
MPSIALTFQTRLENASWESAGDQFECRLSQQVPDFGVGEFVRRAGESTLFRIVPREPSLEPGRALLLAAAPYWRPNWRDVVLGTVQLKDGEAQFNSDATQAGRLLTGFMEGRTGKVKQLTWRGGMSVEVHMLAINFMPAYNDYLQCVGGLLPVNFDQIKNSIIGFPGGGYDLDEVSRAKLEIIADYLKADATVNRVTLEGHSDNSGNRLLNRDLSRRRALAVGEYLKALGIPEERMLIRFLGEREPLVPNNSSLNRAKNRRVGLLLSREPVLESTLLTPSAADGEPATLSD